MSCSGRSVIGLPVRLEQGREPEMWPSLITAAGSLFSGMFSSETSAQNSENQIRAQQQMQQQSEQFNAQEAEKNRNFQQQMSNTAYQRSSADMKAAGLNPMAMFGGGSAASTPAGSTASTGTPSVPMSQKTSPLANLGDAAKTAVSTAVSMKTIDNLVEQNANLKAENEKIVAETGRTKMDVGYVRQKTETEQAETALRKLHIDPASVSASDARTIQEMEGSPLRKAAVKADYLAGKAQSSVDLAGGVIGSAAKAAFVKKFGNATELQGRSATAWRRGYDARANEE